MHKLNNSFVSILIFLAFFIFTKICISAPYFLDPNDSAFEHTGLVRNPFLGILLLGVFCFACFMLTVLRTLVYIFAILMTIAGLYGSDLINIGLPLLLSCIAGTLWDPENGLLINKTSASDFISAESKTTEENQKNTNEQSSSTINKIDSLSTEAQQMVDHFKKVTYIDKDKSVKSSTSEVIKINTPIHTSNSNNSLDTIKSIDKISYAESFDLIGSSGNLLADIGLKLTDGISVFFKRGDAIPVSTQTIFSTGEDYQISLKIALAGKLENEKIFNIGEYSISGINKAPKGIPLITVTVSIKHRELEISATESSENNNLKIIKL